MLPKKNRDPFKALMDYRNTEIQGLGQPPAHLFFGRRLKKTTLPTSADLLRPKGIDVHAKLKARHLNYKKFHDSRGRKKFAGRRQRYVESL